MVSGEPAGQDGLKHDGFCILKLRKDASWKAMTGLGKKELVRWSKKIGALLPLYIVNRCDCAYTLWVPHAGGEGAIVCAVCMASD